MGVDKRILFLLLVSAVVGLISSKNLSADVRTGLMVILLAGAALLFLRRRRT